MQPQGKAQLIVIDLVTTDENKNFAPAGRMAVAIIDLTHKNGGCLPQDLLQFGFTPQETVDLWQMANSMALIELKLMDLATFAKRGERNMPKSKTNDSNNESKKGAPYVTTETINGQTFELTCFEPMHPFDILRAIASKSSPSMMKAMSLPSANTKRSISSQEPPAAMTEITRMLRGVRPERKRTSRLDGYIWLL